MDNKTKYIATILMFLVASTGFLYFYNNGPGINDNRFFKHIVYVIWLLCIYGIGFWAIKKTSFQWLQTIWGIVYFIVIGVLILAGLYELVVEKLPANTIDVLAKVRLFFQTPIPFLIFTSFLASFSYQKKRPQ